MKDLSEKKQRMVIDLFLKGEVYESIEKQTGVSHGSVVNIVDAFGEGKLDFPYHSAAYVDELRRLAVDLRKREMTVAKLADCLELHAVLAASGVTVDEVHHFIEAAQVMGVPTVSGKQMIKASIELAQTMAEYGKSPQETVADYTEKVKQLAQLDAMAELRQVEITDLELKGQAEKKQATEVLDSINKAIATAQQTYQKQKDDLQSDLDKYLVQNKLSWEMANLVLGLLDEAFTASGLTPQERSKLTARIKQAASLTSAITKLTMEVNKLKEEVAGATSWKKQLADENAALRSEKQQLIASVAGKTSENTQLNGLILSRRDKLATLDELVLQDRSDIHVTNMVLGFLSSAQSMTEGNLDDFVNLMTAIRQQRSGIPPRQVRDAQGKVVCRCAVPVIYSHSINGLGVNDARQRLAHYLAPLVEDRFVLKTVRDFDMMMLNAKMLTAELRR